jgi:hypothetical protein
MNCDSFQDKMHEYVDGSLSTDAGAAAEQHLAVCSACRGAVEKEKQFTRVLSKRLRQGSDALTLRPEIRRNILAASRREASPALAETVASWWQQWIRWAIPAAALAIAVMVVMVIHFSGLRSRQTIQAPIMPSLATVKPSPDQNQPPAVSIQISYRLPTHEFLKDGNLVIDTLSSETVVADGNFQPGDRHTVSQTLDIKTPL